MQSIFGHGKPLVFDQGSDRDLQQLFVPAIIEIFEQLNVEPSFLHVTLGEFYATADTDISALLPRVYVDHLPCCACSRIDEFDEAEKNQRMRW
ncbi:hypothetical protein AAVH_11394 [Aphelenchoides avenae]|nr:hypothetical protein AAVH_11394 [Aphelenchus avenae]